MQQFVGFFKNYEFCSICENFYIVQEVIGW